MSEDNGVIYRISGPVVTAVGITPRVRGGPSRTRGTDG